MSKSLKNASQKDAIATTSDIVVYGNTDAWQLLTKASSEIQGWMKSSKAYEIKGVGCVLQVTTEITEPNGRKSIAEAVTFIPNSRIDTVLGENKEVIERKIVAITS